jgi:hypothetical protein
VADLPAPWWSVTLVDASRPVRTPRSYKDKDQPPDLYWPESVRYEIRAYYRGRLEKEPRWRIEPADKLHAFKYKPPVQFGLTHRHVNSDTVERHPSEAEEHYREGPNEFSAAGITPEDVGDSLKPKRYSGLSPERTAKRDIAELVEARTGCTVERGKELLGDAGKEPMPGAGETRDEWESPFTPEASMLHLGLANMLKREEAAQVALAELYGCSTKTIQRILREPEAYGDAEPELRDYYAVTWGSPPIRPLGKPEPLEKRNAGRLVCSWESHPSSPSVGWYVRPGRRELLRDPEDWNDTEARARSDYGIEQYAVPGPPRRGEIANSTELRGSRSRLVGRYVRGRPRQGWGEAYSAAPRGVIDVRRATPLTGKLPFDPRRPVPMNGYRAQASYYTANQAANDHWSKATPLLPSFDEADDAWGAGEPQVDTPSRYARDPELDKDADELGVEALFDPAATDPEELGADGLFEAQSAK